MPEAPRRIDTAAVLARLAAQQQQPQGNERQGFQQLPSTQPHAETPFRRLSGPAGQQDIPGGPSSTHLADKPASETAHTEPTSPHHEIGIAQRTQSQPGNRENAVHVEFEMPGDGQQEHPAGYDPREPTTVRQAYREYAAARRLVRETRRYTKDRQRGKDSARKTPLQAIRDGLHEEKEIAMETFFPKTWRRRQERGAEKAREEAERVEHDIYRGPTLAKTLILNLLGEQGEHEITVEDATGALGLVVKAIHPRDLDLTELDKADARPMTEDEVQTGLDFLVGLVPAGAQGKERVEHVLEAGRGILAADERALAPEDYQKAELVFNALVGKQGEHYRYDPSAVIRALSLIQQALPEMDINGEPEKGVADTHDFTHTWLVLSSINPHREDEGITDLMDVVNYEQQRLSALEHQRDNWQQSPLAPLREEVRGAPDASSEARLRLVDFLFYSSPDSARPDSVRFQAVQDSLTLYMLDRMEDILLYVHNAGAGKTTLPQEGQISARIGQIRKRKELIIGQILDKRMEFGYNDAEYTYTQDQFDNILKLYTDAQYDQVEQATGNGSIFTEPEAIACQKRAGEQALADLVAIEEAWRANIADIEPVRVPGGDGVLYMQALQHLTADYLSRSKGKGSVVLEYKGLIDLHDDTVSHFDIQMRTPLEERGRIPKEPEIHIAFIEQYSPETDKVLKVKKFTMRLVSKGEYARLKGGAWGTTRGALNAAGVWDYTYSPKDHAVILYEPDESGKPISADDQALLEGFFRTLPFQHANLDGAVI